MNITTLLAWGDPCQSAEPCLGQRALYLLNWNVGLSFINHVRYKKPGLLFPFPHRLQRAASA
jgi:hypothetical protein